MTKKWYHKGIKTLTKYEKGDKVLLFNSRLRLFPCKLKSRWYGPYVSRNMKGEAIELCDEEGNEFILNKQRVKLYQKDISDFDADDDVTLDDEGVTNQEDDLMPTIEEGKVIEEFRTRDEDLDTRIDDYPSYCDDDKKINIAPTT
ncbi:hypothetical protein Tco_0479328 [Tanacetum coccineum]